MFTVCTLTGCWPGQTAVTPVLESSSPVVSSGVRTIVGGFGGTEVFSVATRREVSRRGTFEPRSEGPNVSDCPGMGADVPRRMHRKTRGEHLRHSRIMKVDDDGDSSYDLSRGLSRLNSCKPPRSTRFLPPCGGRSLLENGAFPHRQCPPLPPAWTRPSFLFPSLPSV